MATLIKETKIGNQLTTGLVRVTLNQTKWNTFQIDAHMPCGNDWIVGPECNTLKDAEKAFNSMVNDLSKRYC